jgi:hypothetical protein
METEFAPITFEIADDLAHWRAEVPGRVVARAEALTVPTTPPGERVELLNAPGAEIGPGIGSSAGVHPKPRASCSLRRIVLRLWPVAAAIDVLLSRGPGAGGHSGSPTWPPLDKPSRAPPV